MVCSSFLRKQHINCTMSSRFGSFSIASNVLEVVQPPIIGRGICRDEPTSKTGTRMQLIKMLCLTVLPILGLWGYTVHTLADSIDSKEENNKQRSSVYHSIDVGQLVHHLQVERDMSVLYLSELGPETKTFLLSEYIKTDRIIDKLVYWPGDQLGEGAMFLSKSNFRAYLSDHRQILNSHTFSIQQEIDFYSKIIDSTIYWLYNTITESKFSLVWKILVAYQKLASAKENVGVERALGTMFYSQGGFEYHSYFEMYNKKLHSFRAYMKTAGMYSTFVSQIYNVGLRNTGTNITSIIEGFRKEIQTSLQSSLIDYRKSRYWFDNMTIYLDTLLDIQTQMAQRVISILDEAIDDLTTDLAVNAVLLVVVILMCPLVIMATESLTSSIQRYALTLVDKTKELANEKARTDVLLYQMVPKEVAHRLKCQKNIDAEYFGAVTVCCTDIFEFDVLSKELTPSEIIDVITTVYNVVDEILDDFDAFKVETINECYMIASGLPERNKDSHAAEIARFALKMLIIISDMKFNSEKKSVSLRIGIHSGPCTAGIVGATVPRYCLFGETVDTAERMKLTSCENKIQLTISTFTLLNNEKDLKMTKRKDSNNEETYWLMCSSDKNSLGNDEDGFPEVCNPSHDMGKGVDGEEQKVLLKQNPLEKGKKLLKKRKTQDEDRKSMSVSE